MLGRILAKAGYEDVTSTMNPNEALALHTRIKPDLILLDLHMREKDGFAVLEEIVAQNGSHEHVPVIMITADDSADTKRRALALGAKDFVGKPFDSAEVLLRIRNHLETRFLYQKLRDQTSSWRQRSRSARRSWSSHSSKFWSDWRRRSNSATMTLATTPAEWRKSLPGWRRRLESKAPPSS